MVEIKKTKTQKRREKRKKASRKQEERQKENNDSLIAKFFNLSIGKEKPEIFCKDCNDWINKEDLIHFCKNEINLEEFSEDEIETISLAELERYKEKVSEDEIEELQLIQAFQIKN
jgi:hypothetical protein